MSFYSSAASSSRTKCRDSGPPCSSCPKFQNWATPSSSFYANSRSSSCTGTTTPLSSSTLGMQIYPYIHDPPILRSSTLTSLAYDFLFIYFFFASKKIPEIVQSWAAGAASDYQFIFVFFFFLGAQVRLHGIHGTCPLVRLDELRGALGHVLVLRPESHALSGAAVRFDRHHDGTARPDGGRMCCQLVGLSGNNLSSQIPSVFSRWTGESGKCTWFEYLKRPFGQLTKKNESCHDPMAQLVTPISCSSPQSADVPKSSPRWNAETEGG